MDVLASIGLHNLVAMVESRLTHPPSYDAATSGGEGSYRTIPPFPDTNHSTTYNMPQRPQTPPRTRPVAIEHDSLDHESHTSRQPSSLCANSILPSLASLEGCSLYGKTGIQVIKVNCY